MLGIDEVGRGPWAGPLVVGAVVLGDAEIDGLTDSKKLTKKRRDTLDIQIREKAAAYGLGWVSAEEIDDIGLSEALKLATIRAVEQITAPYHEIMIDGTINFLKETSKGQFVTTLAKADLLIPSVSAASIIAKVARDNYMAQQDDVHPGYGFASHVGYGTAAHAAAIASLGVTPLHRTSFAPIAKALSEGATKHIGDAGEDAAAIHLETLGHRILERNWKTKYCEIDIISEKSGTGYFSEVKYRRTAIQGGGLAAITPKKLQQMRFAAEFYATSKRIDGSLQLMAIAVTGIPPHVESVLEIE